MSPIHAGSRRRRRLLLAAVIAGMAGTGAIAGAASSEPEPPSLAEQVDVREVELVLEPPIGKGLADLRPGDIQPTQPQTGPGFQVDGLRLAVPARKGLANLGPGDILVLENGKARPVRRLEPLAAVAASPWTLRVYFDLVLARPDTVFEAALALASQAEPLVGLGSIEIIAADPEPHTLLAPSREIAALREVLARLAGQASRSPAARPFVRVPAPTPAEIRLQCDRLVTSLALSPAAGAHALLLVVDPPAVSPAQLELLTAVSTRGARPGGSDGTPPPAATAASNPGGDPTALALGETARLLAAYGWVTLALPMRRMQGEREPVPEDDAARFRRQWWSDRVPRGVSLLPLLVILFRVLAGKKIEPPSEVRLIAPQVDVANAPLLAMVRPTAGLVIPYRETLAPALGALAGRWHLWYEADATPAPRERQVTVSLLASARELRAPRWVRSSTPEEIAAARLRRILHGDTLAGSMPLTARATVQPLSHSPAPGPVRATPPTATDLAAAAPAGAFNAHVTSDTSPGAAANPPPAASGAPGAGLAGPLVELAKAAPAGTLSSAPASAEGPLRVSFAWIDEAGAVFVAHQLLDAGAAARWHGGQPVCLAAPAPPAGRAGLAVIIEDLGSESWGGTLVPLPGS
ncbi:MAG TPA: hypothetical protein VHR45_19790 [Thermoanaerobaculia bacterium]|nr:hypothetical protein [Thermoanaerobaculia bacterium]